MEYQEMLKNHSEEVNAFPMFFAFNDAQFAEGMESIGLNEGDLSQICRIPTGGFIKKTDKEAFASMLDRQEKERKEAFEDDDFLFEAFKYELSNHEYCITFDDFDTLMALDLSQDDERVNRILNDAIKAYLAETCY